MSMKPLHRAARRRLAATVIILLLTQAAVAEDLLQVYEAARAHDASLQSAVALLRSAEPRAAQAEALLRPSLNVTGSSTRSRVDPPASAFDPAGSATQNHGSNLGVTLRQPLFNRAVSADISKARTGLEIAKTEFETTSQDFIVRVAQVYFDVLSAQDVLSAAHANRTSVARQLSAAQRNFELGTGIVTDVREAEARHDLALAQELAAENDLRVRRLALSRLVGRSDVTPNPLATPVVLPPVTPAEPQAWVGAAEDHPSNRRARLALEVARLDAERARAARLPTIDAVGSVGVSRNTGNGATLPGTNRNASVGVEVGLPLFSGYATHNRIAETRLLEQKAQEDLEAMQNAVAEATERAFFDLQSGHAQVKALEAAEVSSRASLEGTVLSYRAGLRLNLDVLNAQTLLFQTQRDLAKARYDVLMGSLKLRRAAGELKPEDLAAVNRLVVR